MDAKKDYLARKAAAKGGAPSSAFWKLKFGFIAGPALAFSMGIGVIYSLSRNAPAPKSSLPNYEQVVAKPASGVTINGARELDVNGDGNQEFVLEYTNPLTREKEQQLIEFYKGQVRFRPFEVSGNQIRYRYLDDCLK